MNLLNNFFEENYKIFHILKLIININNLMKNIFLIVTLILIIQIHSFSISSSNIPNSNTYTTVFVPCSNLPVSGELVNNNSITTAIPNITQFYIGISGGSDAKLRVYDIKPDSSM